MIIEVLNWKTYVSRTDIQRPGWFCFHVKFFTDPEYIGIFTPHSVAVFCYIAVHAARSKGIMEPNFRHVKAYLSITEDEFMSSVKLLQAIQLVHVDVTRTLRVDHVDVSGAHAGLDRIGRTEQDVKNEPAGSIPTLFPALKAEVPEIEETIIDYDHETVNVPEKERPLPPLAKLWNRHAAKELSQILACTGARRKNALARWKENPREEFWADVIWKINASDFLRGMKPDATWRATFDWLVKVGNADKVREGQYDNRPGPGSGGPTQKKSFFVSELEKKNGGPGGS